MLADRGEVGLAEQLPLLANEQVEGGAPVVVGAFGVVAVAVVVAEDLDGLVDLAGELEVRGASAGQSEVRLVVGLDEAEALDASPLLGDVLREVANRPTGVANKVA